MHAYIYIYIYMCVCIYIYICVCVCAWRYIDAHMDQALKYGVSFLWHILPHLLRKAESGRSNTCE